MATRMDYNSVEQFVAIRDANEGRKVYAIRRNVTGGNPNAQSFAVSLPFIEFKTVGNKCVESALYELFNQWRFEHVKARFQDLPNGATIDDGQFEDSEVAFAYLVSLMPRVAEKLSPQRISNWFHICPVLHNALRGVLAKHKLSDQQLENQVKKFLTGLQKLATKGAVSKTLAERQHRMLSLAGITAEDGVIERLLLKRLNEIINELDEEADDLLDMPDD